MSRRWWIVGAFGCAMAFVVSAFFVLEILFDDRRYNVPRGSPVLLWALPIVFAFAGKGMIWLAFKTSPAELRRRRGLCEQCGYDLRASTGRCPECGRAIH